MHHECPSTWNSRPLNSQRGRCSRTSPNIWAEHGACVSAGTKLQPIDIIPNPPPSSPNARVELIGRVNEADIFIDDIWVTALIDMEAQGSIITRDFCEQHRYDIYPMKQMLHLEGTGGFSIPSLWYIEATVRIPPIKDYEEYVPMLVLKSFSSFSSRVPVLLGTNVLDWNMAKIMVEELACASNTWWQTYMSTVATAGAAGTAEQGGHSIPLLVTRKSVMIPPSVA